LAPVLLLALDNLVDLVLGYMLAFLGLGLGLFGFKLVAFVSRSCCTQSEVFFAGVGSDCCVCGVLSFLYRVPDL